MARSWWATWSADRARRVLNDGQFGRVCCRIGAFAWLFISPLFVANAAVYNLGFSLLATGFNGGRATLDTIPIVSLGASWYGIEGGVARSIARSMPLGHGATTYFLTGRLAKTYRSD